MRSLPDLCDDYPDVVRVAEPIFSHFGGRVAFGGPVRTVKCVEDNSLVAERLGQAGDGAVLVVDGGGSKRCGLVGDNLAGNARDNGWQGIVVYGCVRDVEILATIDVGIVALGAHPLKSIKRQVGMNDVELRFAGVSWMPDQFVYCDANGVLVAPVPLD